MQAAGRGSSTPSAPSCTSTATAATPSGSTAACSASGARFSFMGDASGPLGATITYDVAAGEVTVERGRRDRGPATSRSSTTSSASCARLRHLADRPPLRLQLRLRRLPRLRAEGRLRRRRRRTPRRMPDAAFVFADRLIAFDHERGRTYLLCLAEPGDEPQPRPGSLDRRSQPAARPRGRRSAERPGRSSRSRDSPLATARPRRSSPRLARSHEQYLDDIAACQQRLRDGETLRDLPHQQDHRRGRRRPARALPDAAPRQPGALRGLPALRRARRAQLLARALPARSTATAGRRRSRSRAPRRAATTPAEDVRLAEALRDRREEPRREPDDRRPAAQRPRLGLRGRHRRRARA